jgi:hypothetical protein
MSANTITGLVPTIYKAVDRVMREQTGFLGSVFVDPSAEMVAKDQNITYPIVPAMTAADVTPAAVPTEPTGKTIGYGSMSISKSRVVKFHWTVEDQTALGSIYDAVKQDQFSQAFRTLVNEMETDLFTAAKTGASRAYGTAAVTPFASAGVLTDVAEIRQILVDNGAWTSDMHLTLSTASGTKIRGVQANLFKVDEAGDASLLREGRLGNLEGFQIHESSAIVSHTKGTGASYLLDLTAGYAVGSTAIHVDGGTGTILAGDIITNTKTSRDTNKYVVNTGCAGDADQDIVLGKPGNKIAWVNNDPITVGGSYTGNFAYERNALHLLTRLPKLPKEGALGEHVVVTDPFSGISFLVSTYPAYHEVIVEVSVAWGVKAAKSEAIAILLG